jgi:hypothetical protein
MYSSYDEAKVEAKYFNCKAYRFEWDGIDPKKLSHISEI